MIQGLVVFDWWHRREEAMARLAAWHRGACFQIREGVLGGFERAPECLPAHDVGRNFGKPLVRLSAKRGSTCVFGLAGSH